MVWFISFFKKSQAVALTIGLLFGFSSLAWAEASPLRIGVDENYPPFSYTDEDGQLTGFDVDIAYALCKQLGRPCDVRAIPFDQIIPQLVENSIDLGIAGLGATPERQKLVDFTERYFRSHSIFIELEGNGLEPSLEALAGKRIGTQAGTLQETYLHDVYGDVAEIVAIAEYEQLFEELKAKRLDLIFVDGLPAYYYMRSENGRGLETVGQPIHSDVVLDSSSIAVSKRQHELVEKINQAIQDLRRSGEYDRINRKYFDFNVY